MTNPFARLNGWAKALALFLPLLVAGLIAFGSLKSDVQHAEAAIYNAATQKTVDVQYEAILRELRSLNDRMARLEARR